MDRRNDPLWPDQVFDALRSSFGAFDNCMAKMDMQRNEQGCIAKSNDFSFVSGYQFIVEFPGVAKPNLKVRALTYSRSLLSCLQVEVSGRELTMEGRLSSKPNPSNSFYRERCNGDRLYRKFTFNHDIDPSSVTADFNDGLLDVRVGLKTAAKQSVHIPLK